MIQISYPIMLQKTAPPFMAHPALMPKFTDVNFTAMWPLPAAREQDSAMFMIRPLIQILESHRLRVASFSIASIQIILQGQSTARRPQSFQTALLSRTRRQGDI